MCFCLSGTVLYHVRFQIPQYNLDNIFSGCFFFEYCSLQLCGQSIAVSLCHSFLFTLFPCSSMGPPNGLQIPWGCIRRERTCSSLSLWKPRHVNPAQHMILLLKLLFLRIMRHSSRREREVFCFKMRTIALCRERPVQVNVVTSSWFTSYVRVMRWFGFTLVGWCFWAYVN